jgi:hypothetical protein
MRFPRGPAGHGGRFRPSEGKSEDAGARQLLTPQKIAQLLEVLLRFAGQAEMMLVRSATPGIFSRRYRKASPVRLCAAAGIARSSRSLQCWMGMSST